MAWPTRTQLLGLLIVLGVLVVYVLVRVGVR
jgi:preprotein translocase subunit SecE